VILLYPAVVVFSGGGMTRGLCVPFHDLTDAVGCFGGGFGGLGCCGMHIPKSLLAPESW
jgi:hypothetical protein